MGPVREEQKTLDSVPLLGTIVPVMGTDIISSLLPRTRLRLLALLMRDPSQELYVREIIRRTEIGQGVVQRELASLARAGILLRRVHGNRTYFRANPACPIYPELRGLMLKTAGLVDLLAEALKPLGSKVAVAFVYGSLARGEASAGSDVDLAVIGSASFRDVVARLSKAQSTLGREVNPTVFSAAEFRRRAKQKEHFVTGVLRRPKLFVVGGEDDLRTMAE